MENDLIIKDTIRKIYRGTYKPNKKILSIKEASKKYNVSLSTVKNKYNQLVNLGVLYRKQGKGFYITSYWDSNIISSPSLEDNIFKTELIELSNYDFNNKYNDIFQKTQEGNWDKFVKFYYDEEIITKFNIFIINKDVVPNAEINNIKGSFISFLYNNDYFPSSEIVETFIRKGTKIEAGILQLNKTHLVVEENIVTMDNERNIICFSKWILNPLVYKSKRFKGNY